MASKTNFQWKLKIITTLAKLVLKGPNVRLPVHVMKLVQSVQNVISPQVNVLATLDIPELLAILVPPTTSEQVMEFAKP